MPKHITLLKYFHYLIIAVAGNEVWQHQQLTHCKQQENERLMLVAYENWCEKISSHFPEWKMPEWFSKSLLMKADEKTVTGSSLWRKFIELRSFIIKSCNPRLRELKEGETREELLLSIRKELWTEKEEQFVKRYPNRTTREFLPSWMPKEWYAFVSCGAPAESRALEVFFKSKNLQSRKIFDGISQIQDRTFSCNSDFDTLDYDYDYDSDLSPQSFPSSEFVSTTGKGLKRSLDSNCDLDSKFDLVPTSHIVLDVHDTSCDPVGANPLLLEYELELRRYDREKLRLRELHELETDEAKKKLAKEAYLAFLRLPVPVAPIILPLEGTGRGSLIR